MQSRVGKTEIREIFGHELRFLGEFGFFNRPPGYEVERDERFLADGIVRKYEIAKLLANPPSDFLHHTTHENAMLNH